MCAPHFFVIQLSFNSHFNGIKQNLQKNEENQRFYANQPTNIVQRIGYYLSVQSVSHCPVLSCTEWLCKLNTCRWGMSPINRLFTFDHSNRCWTTRAEQSNKLDSLRYLLTSLELPFRILPFLNSATCVNLQSSSVHILKLRVHWSHVGESWGEIIILLISAR